MFTFKITGLDKLQKQIEHKKKRILEGVKEGLEDAGIDILQIMHYYMKKKVYDVYEPVKYKRTYDLQYSLTKKIEGYKLFVYSDPNRLDIIPQYNVPYSFRVFYGDKKYHYEYPKDGSMRPYKLPRNWAEPTVKEFKEHQGYKLKKIMKDAIQKKI